MTEPTENNQLPCADKMAFDTQAQAEGVAVTAEWQHGSKLTTYHCQYCGLWHLATDHQKGE